MNILFILFIWQVVNAEKKCWDTGYIDENGECVPCLSGYYCDGKVKIECPDGYYSFYMTGKCVKCGCNNCSKTDIINKDGNEILDTAGRCPPDEGCYPGYGYDDSFERCEICKPGFYSSGEREKCNTCPPRTISRTYGSTTCEECPEGMFTNIEQTECMICPPGTFIFKEFGQCSSCMGETISREYGTKKCTPCKEDEHANEEHTECLPGVREGLDRGIFLGDPRTLDFGRIPRSSSKWSRIPPTELDNE